MNDLVGQSFGEYHLTRFLGGGHFADVYEAEHIYLKTRFAVKLLRGAFTQGDMEDFRKEARLLVELVQDHIVRVYTFNVERDIPYLVMSYAPNGSLDKLHARGTKLPLSIIVSYVKQIADALQYAHEHRVIHRDINPANLLLGKEGQILVADFGIAEITQRTSSWGQQKPAGTPLYMAPEQFDGQARPASDQYALGIVVYQWLCGHPPFIGNETALAYQHKITPPPPLREKISISPAVEAVVLRALAKKQEHRFPTIQDFARALEQAYTEEIKTLFTMSERTTDALMQDHVQDILPDLIVRDPDWWHHIGRAAINNLRTQAVRESRTDIFAVLSTFTQRAASEASVAIERGDEAGFVNLLELVSFAALPSTDPQVWTFLLKSLSAVPRALEIVTDNAEIYSWLLRQWGSVSSSVENTLIRKWFPKTWSELWPFLELSLPEEWHDMALVDLLDETSSAAVLPVSIVRSIEREYSLQLETFLRRPLRSLNRRRVVIRLFSKLVESGYARKMNLLHMLLTSDIDPAYVKDFMERVLAVAYLTDEEIVQLLERYGSRFESYYRLPIVLGYASKYLLAFSPNDLDRPSAKQLVQFMSSSSLIPLPQDLRVLAENWRAISTFIDQPDANLSGANQKELLALANTINQLPPATHSILLDKLSTSFISCIESEIDLMCVIYTMKTVLTDSSELLHFLHHLAEIIGEKYQRERSETILIPYIRIALQLESIVSGVSKADKQQFVMQFLRILLLHADRETYKKLNIIAQNWPARISAEWHDYTSRDHPESPSERRRRPWDISHR